MKRKITLLWIVAALILCLQSAVFAQFITAKELAGMMNDPNVRIVSARNAKDYGKVHIKNAIHITMDDLYKPGPIKDLLKSPDKIAKILGDKGISEKNTIVLYCYTGTTAGRLYWILKYLGAKDVRILAGQMKAWRKARKPVTKAVPNFPPTTFTPTVNNAIFADMKYVKAHLNDPKVILVDNRSKEEYDGQKGEAKRKGHIPGAINFDYKNVLDNGFLKPKAELQKMFKAAGITPDKEVILYCETSTRAGIVFVALKDVLGYPNVKVYDGAIYEWAADASNPMK